MAKVSVNLISKVVNDAGESPVEVWVNHKSSRRKRRLFWLEKRFWDKKKSVVLNSHPNQVRMNKMIKSITKEFKDRIFDFEMEGVQFTAADVIKGRDKKSKTLIELIDEMRLSKARLGQKANSYSFKSVSDKIQAFKPHATPQDVNKEFVDHFKAFLWADNNITSQSTVHRYIKRLKQVLKHEFEQGKYHDQQVLNYQISAGKSKKSILTHDELRAWQSVEVPHGLEKWRDFFMMLYYLRGARVGDGLQLGQRHIQKNRIQYKEQKTNQFQNQLIPPQLQTIIDRYEGQSEHYLIPIMRMPPSSPDWNDGYQNHIKSCTAKLNLRYKVIAEMAGINKRITNHVARHTFASHAKNAGLATGIIQEMLNHSSESTTENYIQSLVIHEQLDNEAMKVFG